MKKLCHGITRPFALFKFNLKMKLTTLCFLVSLFGLHANNSYSQKTVTLKLNDVQISQLLDLIENQTEYHFVYKIKDVNLTRKIQVNAQDEKVSGVLEKIFKGTDTKYEFYEDQIFLTKKPAKLSSNTTPINLQETITVTGTVTEAETGMPVPAANILEIGTSNGVMTDFDGNYSIEVSEGAILKVSYIGYATQEVEVNGRNEIDIALKQDAAALDEVVVVGYGIQKKSDLTGAISSVNSEELTKGGSVSNVAQALQGKASGVSVTQNSNAPGGSMSIRIRGSNSVSSSNEPLYVVDGFPTTNGANINTDDIESMEILKDASATAIYGSRGANGVVLITTKRGKAGESTISYNGYTSIQKPIVPFDMLNSKEYMSLANDLYREIAGQENQEFGEYTQSQLDSDINTDWIEAATRNGKIQDHNIQFRTGSEKTKILSSIGYFDQEGILKNTNFSRVSGRINIDQTFNDYIKSGASVLAQRENSNYQNYAGNVLNSNVLYGILTYDPTVPVYNEDGSFGRPPGGKGDNPLANLLSRINDLQKDKFNGTLYLEVTPIKQVNIRMNAGTEIVQNKIGNYLSKASYQGSIDEGVASVTDFSLTHNLLDVVANYNDEFNDKHSLNLMGGYSYEKFINESKGANVYGFSTDLYEYNNLGAASTITDVSSYKSENMLVSFFGRANYVFDEKYLFTFTIRADGSSRFGEENKWGTFPSGSIAWRLINESFMTDQDVFSDLKLRAGYGKTGNERIGNYASYGLISNSNYTFDGITNTSGAVLSGGSPENAGLKWETTSQYNIGADIGVFHNRIHLSMDAYYKKTDDLLINVNLPFYTGYTSGLSNVGSIENKGFEFTADSKNIVGDFTWDTQLNFSLNRNKVLNLGKESEILLTSSKPFGSVSEENYAIIREGEALGSLFGYKYQGVLQEGEDYAPQPQAVPGDPKFADINGDGEITSADRTIIGNAHPKFSFGLTNNFTYANFDLSFFIYGNLGNELLNMTRMNLEWKRTTTALDRWTPENTNTDIPRNGFFYSQYGGYINDHFIEDASFIRLRNLTLGYTLPLENRIIKSFRVYAMAENLFTITDYSGWDPEVDTKAYENDNILTQGGNSQSANAGAGLDFNSYPSMKSFTLGLNIDF
ncbi:TonB-linked outer membrane protein, SusC/RagA family [Salegentibacter echinorum]|uniref:TonB-linked outer membrane protein, SusC/RagA family n=1 Tax=Salegentibacter echinorum TaxID=1073325 RepID=A0A1M5IDQ2_SALEC|nr:TonB-dependent receptor [Salegentibacter echinorum]SHG26426.1 TonB-linked outer membrane protein, SusC/RagA family [Salegentibacter echinorum]